MLKEIFNFLLKLKPNYRHTITVLLFVSGIGALVRPWWEQIVYKLLNIEFQISDDTEWSVAIGIFLLALGFILFLLNRHDRTQGEKRFDKSEPSNTTIIHNTYTGNPDSDRIASQETDKPDINVLPFQPLTVGDVDEFIGREEALSWLETRILEPEKSRTLAIASVQGGGGMGKTFLTRKFVSQYYNTLTFIEIYVGERSAFEAGLEFLSRLGVNIDQISNEEQLRIVLKHCFTNESGCLVLDDVYQNDVEILIPDNLRWTTLITTRYLDLAKKLSNDHVLELDRFSPEEAMQLFKAVLDKDFDTAIQQDYKSLAKYLGLRPYGIRLAANSLKPGITTLSPKELMQQLKAEGMASPSENNPLADQDIHQLRPLLEHCLNQLESLSPFARQLLNHLAVCADEGIEVKHFIAWQQTENPGENIEHSLLQIKNLSLLFIENQIHNIFGQEQRGTSIRLHTDLLNLLREVSLKEEIDSLQAFLHQVLVLSTEPMESYKTLQFQVNHLIMGVEENNIDIESLYDYFWIHLYKTGRLLWAYDLGNIFLNQNERLGDQAGLSRSYGNQALILKAWGKLEEAMALHKQEEALKIELGDQAGLSRSYGNQALILQAWGKLEEAMALHKQEEALKIELGDQAGLSRSYGNQALILQAWGKLEEAMALLKQQEALCEELGDQAGLSACYGNQALILKAWGKLEEAMALHKQEEALCEELGDQAGLSTCYGNQALILQAWGKLEEAMALHKQEEALCEELGDQAGLSRSYGNQALILQAWGKLEEAMALHKQEEALCEELGDQAGLSACYGNQALILKAWGKLEEAMALLKQQEALCEELGDQAGLSACYGNQALILQDWGKLEEAMALLKQQEALCEELGDQAGLSACYGNQALILQDWGKLEEAMALLKQQEALCEELGDQAGLSACYGNQALILQAWGKLEEAMALLKQQEALCEELGDQAGRSTCYGNQALILQAWGKLEEAMALLKQQEALCEELGDQAGLSRSYGNQALILQAWGKLEEAMALLKQQEALCEELGDQAGLAICYWNMGLIYKENNDSESAIEQFKKTINLERALNHPDLEQCIRFLEDYEKEI